MSRPATPGGHRPTVLSLPSPPPPASSPQLPVWRELDAEGICKKTARKSSQNGVLQHPTTSTRREGGRRTESRKNVFHRRMRSISSIETIHGKLRKIDLEDPSDALDENELPEKASIFHDETYTNRSKDKLELATISAMPPAVDYGYTKPGILSAAHGKIFSETPDLDSNPSIGLSGVSLLEEELSGTHLWPAAVNFPIVADDVLYSFGTVDGFENCGAGVVVNSQSGVETPLKKADPDARLFPLLDWCTNNAYPTPAAQFSEISKPPHTQLGSLGFGRATAGTDELSLYTQDPGLEVTFKNGRFFHIWDMDDDKYFECPARINIVMKKRYLGDDQQPSMPHIRLLDIQCYTQHKASIYSEFDSEYPHIINYTGSHISRDEGGVLQPFPCENGIAVEPRWIWTTSAGSDIWYINIWIPIPVKLFVKKETRTFMLRASIWYGEEREKHVEGSQEMAISHLRKEREML